MGPKLSQCPICLCACVFVADVMIMLVGTKLDLVTHNPHQREVEQSMAENLSKSKRQIVGFYETSARDNIHVQDVFVELAQALLKKHTEDRTVTIHNLQNLAGSSVDSSEINVHRQRGERDPEKSTCPC